MEYLTTDKEGIKILIEVLKEKGIRQVVLSPGSRNAPLLVAFAREKQIRHFVVLDERSAAFMALGMAQQSGVPVALVCTSGTAPLNYAPAIAEAYYQRLPLIVITADRPVEWIDQDDSQTIRQQAVFRNIVKASYQLPAELFHADEHWYANRLVNDALNTALKGRQGPVLKAGYKSFVGMLPLPVLHGCTIGELAQMINGEGWMTTQAKTCPLTVIPVKGWKHGQPYVLPVKPSPNLPNAQSIRLYASLCPFEATRVSVGRGTTFPFQVLGAPNKKYGDFAFTPRSLPGFDKNPMHKGVTCYGEDLRNVTDVNGFTLRYFLRFYRLSGEGAAFFSRPRWFDLLMGTDSVRKAILKGESEEEIRDSWQKELQTYRDMRQKYLLY